MAGAGTDLRTYFDSHADDLLAAAVVRITGDRSGGTGWFASPGGMVVTCHHVVAPHEAVTITRHDGQTITVKREKFLLNPAFDLALVPTGWDDVCCLAAAAWPQPPPRYVSRGFPATGVTTGAHPTGGGLTGGGLTDA